MKLNQKDYINFNRETNHLCCFGIMMISTFLELKPISKLKDIVRAIKVNESFLNYTNFSCTEEQKRVCITDNQLPALELGEGGLR